MSAGSQGRRDGCEERGKLGKEQSCIVPHRESLCNVKLRYDGGVEQMEGRELVSGDEGMLGIDN
jgi:hypothetical protein